MLSDLSIEEVYTTDCRVRVSGFWNEEFPIVIQHKPNHEFNDVFVWGWEECQNPRFLYSYNLKPIYPTGLFPTSFFLYKKYLVLMPDTTSRDRDRSFQSMIRTHDISNQQFDLVGSYDRPEDSKAR